MIAAALTLTGIRKSFDGFVALDGANFMVRAGEVHGLLGENGAGKSSLMNVAAGLYAPDAGRIAVDGIEIALSGPRAAAANRIGMVHQHFKLVSPFTVAENILLTSTRRGFSAGRRAVQRDIRRQAEALGFEIDPLRRIDTLSVAERQRVEIIKVLLTGARILILDEPTAVLTDEEATRLLHTIRGLAARGTAIVLVTHKLAEVNAAADRVTVMRAGRDVATLDPKDASTDELTRLTVGSTIAAPRRSFSVPGERRLTVKGLRCARADGHLMVIDTSFHVRSGEIYGVAGVGGNGQTELAEALVGVRRPVAGSIVIEGLGEATNASPERLRDLGIASVPADRHTYGLAGALSVAENFCIGQIHNGRYGSWARINRAAMRKDAAEAVRGFDVQGVRSLGQKSALLSGGNAQKLVLAREFSRVPAVVVAHSPSRGLDIRACAAVHERLLAARTAGAAIVLISDDLDEILNLADRIGVMTRGRIAAEFDAPADRQEVGRIMVDHA
jgi:simple sugar transport system ATP-binding protein